MLRLRLLLRLLLGVIQTRSQLLEASENGGHVRVDTLVVGFVAHVDHVADLEQGRDIGPFASKITFVSRETCVTVEIFKYLRP